MVNWLVLDKRRKLIRRKECVNSKHVLLGFRFYKCLSNGVLRIALYSQNLYVSFAVAELLQYFRLSKTDIQFKELGLHGTHLFSLSNIWFRNRLLWLKTPSRVNLFVFNLLFNVCDRILHVLVNLVNVACQVAYDFLLVCIVGLLNHNYVFLQTLNLVPDFLLVVLHAF